MEPDHVQTTSGPARGPSLTTAEIVDRLSRFDGPPEQFLVNLLAVQCRLAAAEAGAVLRAGANGQMELLAIYPQLPDGPTAPVWLAQAVESAGEVVSGGATAVKPLHDPDELYGQPARRHLIMVPILTAGNVRGLAAFFVDSRDPTVLNHCRERLELSISLLSLYEMRLTLQRRQLDMQRLRIAMETLAAVNEHDRFAGAGMAMCNEVASRWQCDRVALGFLKGRYVHLKALSHTEKINRKMKLVQDIEASMEECLDQDVEVLYPASEDATYVSRAAAELSRLHGPMTVISIPLRRGGDVVGVLTAERAQDNPFMLEEIEALRLTCDLCTARLVNMHSSDRWFGARAVASARKGLGRLVGPKHTLLKAAAILLCAFLAFALLAKGDYRASASFVIEPTVQRVVSAPFDGYIDEVFVEPGDEVIAGTTVLAKLKTTEMETSLVQARADYASAIIEMQQALAEGKTNEAQQAQARAEKAQAQIGELQRRIEEASVRSPITGTIISPDIKRRQGASVELGEAMFEVAPIESLRAELSVSEDQIADVLAAFRAARDAGSSLRGEMATEGSPGRRITFTVERINPVAEVEEKENVFKVRVRLDEVPRGLALIPGMKGVAKIEIGRRRYISLWTRKLVNWVRMKLWI